MGWYADCSARWTFANWNLIAAIFYAALKTGSDSINMYTAVPKEIVAIIQGMIILFLAVKFIGDKTSVFSHFKKAKKEDA